uniref:Uncharacterized protein n=1 Tax=Gasterosteus aculeatus aculeatus TaxID=481459 RepID=A0AAQ4S6S9_GASAC
SRKILFCGHSSEPSGQSASPSQLHWVGTHTESLHWKELELQVGVHCLAANPPHVAGSSSVPSPQSSVPSQIHLLVTHLPFPHFNWVELHMKAASVSEND